MSSFKSRKSPLLLASSALLTCGVASAQEALEDTSAIEEVVVTAQKREQTLSDVAAAVTALTSDRLTTSQVASIQDLQTLIPSVNFGSDFNQAKIFIRGVGANTSTTGNSTAVALHVDGAVVARAEAQLTSLFDLERVEVLRGPQGTLYGRNATGGSINLITAKPTQELSGYARMTYGNYSAFNTEAALSGGLTDKLSARLAVKSEDRDGFGTNPVTGQDVDDLNRQMARAQLKYDFSDAVNLLVSAELFRQNDSSGAVHYLRASFPGVARLAPLGVGGYATNPRDLASEIQPGTQTDSKSYTATLHVGATDQLSFTNIANYRRFKTSLFQDLDLSAVVESLTTNGQPTTVQERRIDSEQYSNELQINWNSDFVNAVGGLFYFHERQQPIDNVGLSKRNGMQSNIAKYLAAGVSLAEAYDLCGYGPGSVTGGSAVIAPKRVCTKSDLGTDAYALFGQANLNLGRFSDSLAAWTIKAGGRYSKEDVESANPSIVITAGGAGAVLHPTTASTYRSRSFSDFTPELGLQWEASKDLMAYYTYSEGFKAGSGENASGSTTIVDPETMKNHEAGVKASFLDRRLSANLAVYHYKLEGAQLNKTIAGGPTGYTTIFQNAASTSADGVELELAARLSRALRLSAAVSYTDATFDDYLTLDPLNPVNIAGGTPYNAVTNPDPTAFGAPGGGNIQLAGNRVRNTPDWAWNVHGEYDLPFALLNDGYLTLQGDVSHKSRVFFSEYERAIESAAGYTMVDASLQFTSGDDHLRVQAWVKNLTDTERASSTFALATGRLIGVTYLQPRLYGLTVGYKL
jgi:iron complex outermembrane receptor protein